MSELENADNSDELTEFETIDRRRLMAGGVAAALAGAGIATPSGSATAANGTPVILGASSTASAVTRVTTTGGHGIMGVSSGPGKNGVVGKSTSGYGVRGESKDYIGVSGYTTSSSDSIGVHGFSTSSFGVGVHGECSGGVGISGKSTTGHAGSFQGKVHVAGTLTKASGSFRIDHPLDPANKCLSHSFVESPDMMNIYNGVATLDDKGAAAIEMPDWFDALNRDFRYQLTPMDAPAPNVHVSSRLLNGVFTIAGGHPGQEISWQVTGIRQDAWANAHRVPVEEDKTGNERGTYLHPDVVTGGMTAFSA